MVYAQAQERKKTKKKNFFFLFFYLHLLSKFHIFLLEGQKKKSDNIAAVRGTWEYMSAWETVTAALFYIYYKR